MDIPDQWEAALAAVQSVCPAVMAGGCLRDLDNDRPVKDIDIFVHGRGVDDLERLRNRLIKAGLTCAELDTDTLYPVGDGNDLTGCIDCAFDDCPPVQIVMVDWPLDAILERFDFGICRISFNGKQLIRHPDYVFDRSAKSFQLRRRREGQELSASVHRFARLTLKYEGWKFVPYDEVFDWADAS